MSRVRVLSSWALILAAAGVVVLIAPGACAQSHSSGKLAGFVLDASGAPQMGAHVELVAETMAGAAAQSIVTNLDGMFRSDHLPPGLYTVRVTLAGFLPTLEQHVRIAAHLTTVVHVQLESMFASLDQLRRQPAAATAEADDWKWVLRSASNTRPVLQWVDTGGLSASNDPETQILRPKARVEFTDGARQPGFVSSVPVSPATAFAYQQRVGEAGNLILAGQLNYEADAPGGGFAAVWAPAGQIGNGPQSTMVLREEKLGQTGPTFRAARFDQSGAIALGDHTVLRYGGEFVLVGMQKSAHSLRPRTELETRVSTNWTAIVTFAAEPDGALPSVQDADDSIGTLEAALAEFDAFPALMRTRSHPVLQGGWHEEISANRKMGDRGQLQLAAFHDDDQNMAVLGKGAALPSAEYMQTYFSDGFAYDAGSVNSWGTRVAYEEKIDNNVKVTAVYAFAGGLAPGQFVGNTLRSMLDPAMHSTVGGNVSAKINRSRTEVNAGYQWVSGRAVTLIDGYGQALFQTEPYLHMGLRQSLPKFGPGRWEAIAECDNLLGQGYLPTRSQDGKSDLLPAFRSFRGGVSVQF